MRAVAGKMSTSHGMNQKDLFTKRYFLQCTELAHTKILVYINFLLSFSLEAPLHMKVENGLFVLIARPTFSILSLCVLILRYQCTILRFLIEFLFTYRFQMKGGK